MDLDNLPPDAHDGGMTTSRDSNRCPEPDGQEHPLEGDPRTAHDIMLDEAGHCPWCGEEG